METTTTRPDGMIDCPCCGKRARPGPMQNHLKVCDKNPEAEGMTIVQPTAQCQYCGKTSTAGAIKTHELYGCPNRPADDEAPGVGACPHCGKTSTAGALVSHVRACPENPDVPRMDEPPLPG